jgi:integral membrane protein (TIGR01906 family)
MEDTKGWIVVVRTLVQVVLPVAMVLTSVRLLLTQAFVRFEYNVVGVPADRYGFTKEDRLKYADIALEYLLNDAGIEFLGDLEFEDGAQVYNERELGHMEDVKVVTRATLRVWLISIAVAVLASVALARFSGIAELWDALRSGSTITFVLMGLLGVGLVVGFSVIFVGFHQVFFDPDTWTFPFEDTLIRLFPERFWQVAFGTIAALTLLQAGLLYGVSRLMTSRA